MINLGTSIASRVHGGPSGIYSNINSLDLDGSDAFDPQLSEAELQAIVRDSHSISLWVKMPWDRSGHIFGYVDTGNNVAGGILLNYLYFNSSVDAFQMSGKFGGGNWNAMTLINHAAADDADAWVHMCVSQTKGAGDSDNGSSQVYINGSAVFNSATPTKLHQEATAVTSGRGLLFGASDTNGTATGNVIGKIDDIAIWTTGLDAAAVLAIYNSGVPTDLRRDKGNYDNASDLKHYYKVQSNAVDRQGNSDGALVGDPVYSTDTP